jgi:tRNA threonylcarbamoyladenosine biosynthesis protein TsaE
MAKAAKSKNPDLELTTKSPEETQAFAASLGALLKKSDVVALIGELGSGKTTFIQGLAKGMKLDPNFVKSPTFILLREYKGELPLIHIDGYRLEGSPDAVLIDLDWMFSPKKVTVIEWADKLFGCLPEDYLELRFAHKSSHQRTIAAFIHGSRSKELVDALKESITDTEAVPSPKETSDENAIDENTIS